MGNLKEHLFSFGAHTLKPEHSAYCGHSKCGHLVTNASIYLFNQSNSLCLNLSVGLSNNVNWQCYRSWKYLNTFFCYNAAFNIVWLFPWAFSSFCLANHKTNTLITGAPICTHPCAKKQRRANNIAHVSTVDLLMKSSSCVLELFIIKIYSILLPEQFNQ